MVDIKPNTPADLGKNKIVGNEGNEGNDGNKLGEGASTVPLAQTSAPETAETEVKNTGEQNKHNMTAATNTAGNEHQIIINNNAMQQRLKNNAAPTTTTAQSVPVPVPVTVPVVAMPVSTQPPPQGAASSNGNFSAFIRNPPTQTFRAIYPAPVYNGYPILSNFVLVDNMQTPATTYAIQINGPLTAGQYVISQPYQAPILANGSPALIAPSPTNGNIHSSNSSNNKSIVGTTSNGTNTVNLKVEPVHPTSSSNRETILTTTTTTARSGPVIVSQRVELSSAPSTPRPTTPASTTSVSHSAAQATTTVETTGLAASTEELAEVLATMLLKEGIEENLDSLVNSIATDVCTEEAYHARLDHIKQQMQFWPHRGQVKRGRPRAIKTEDEDETESSAAENTEDDFYQDEFRKSVLREWDYVKKSSVGWKYDWLNIKVSQLEGELEATIKQLKEIEKQKAAFKGVVPTPASSSDIGSCARVRVYDGWIKGRQRRRVHRRNQVTSQSYPPQERREDINNHPLFSVKDEIIPIEPVKKEGLAVALKLHTKEYPARPKPKRGPGRPPSRHLHQPNYGSTPVTPSTPATPSTTNPPTFTTPSTSVPTNTVDHINSASDTDSDIDILVATISDARKASLLDRRQTKSIKVDIPKRTQAVTTIPTVVRPRKRLRGGIGQTSSPVPAGTPSPSPSPHKSLARPHFRSPAASPSSAIRSPASTRGISLRGQRKKSNKREFDINNVVIPWSDLRGNFKIEEYKPVEIYTPKFREKTDEGKEYMLETALAAAAGANDVIAAASPASVPPPQGDSSDEDTSDEAYAMMHYPRELKERHRYENYAAMIKEKDKKDKKDKKAHETQKQTTQDSYLVSFDESPNDSAVATTPTKTPEPEKQRAPSVSLAFATLTAVPRPANGKTFPNYERAKVPHRRSQEEWEIELAKFHRMEALRKGIPYIESPYLEETVPSEEDDAAMRDDIEDDEWSEDSLAEEDESSRTAVRARRGGKQQRANGKGKGKGRVPRKYTRRRTAIGQQQQQQQPIQQKVRRKYTRRKPIREEESEEEEDSDNTDSDMILEDDDDDSTTTESCDDSSGADDDDDCAYSTNTPLFNSNKEPDHYEIVRVVEPERPPLPTANNAVILPKIVLRRIPRTTR